jgi:hypothetical protein
MTAADSVTTSVTVLLGLADLFFLTAEYYLKRETGGEHGQGDVSSKGGWEIPLLSSGRQKQRTHQAGGRVDRWDRNESMQKLLSPVCGGGKRRLVRVGTDPAAAAAAAKRKELALKAHAAGIRLVLPPSSVVDRVVLTEAAEIYLDRLRLGRCPLVKPRIEDHASRHVGVQSSIPYRRPGSSPVR